MIALEKKKREYGDYTLERKKQMDSIEVMIARIDERTKIGFETNDACHNEIKNTIEKLTIHVNHENELLTGRITDIEQNGSSALKNFENTISENLKKLTECATDNTKRIGIIELDLEKTKSERNGQKKIYQSVIAILAIVSTIMGLAHLLRVF